MRLHPHYNVARVGFEPAPEKLDTDYQPRALTITPQSASKRGEAERGGESKLVGEIERGGRGGREVG